MKSIIISIISCSLLLASCMKIIDNQPYSFKSKETCKERGGTLGWYCDSWDPDNMANCTHQSYGCINARISLGKYYKMLEKEKQIQAIEDKTYAAEQQEIKLRTEQKNAILHVEELKMAAEKWKQTIVELKKRDHSEVHARYPKISWLSGFWCTDYSGYTPPLIVKPNCYREIGNDGSLKEIYYTAKTERVIGYHVEIINEQYFELWNYRKASQYSDNPGTTLLIKRFKKHTNDRIEDFYYRKYNSKTDYPDFQSMIPTFKAESAKIPLGVSNVNYGNIYYHCE